MSWVAWLVIAGGAVFVLLMVLLVRRAQVKALEPVSLIDRRVSYVATVRYLGPSDADGGSGIVMVDYEDAAGETHRAGLADLIHPSWIDRFEEGSQWKVHAYTVPGPRVVLTEAHDEVWRRGWNLVGTLAHPAVTDARPATTTMAGIALVGGVVLFALPALIRWWKRR